MDELTGRHVLTGASLLRGGNSKVYGAALFRLRERDFGEVVHARVISAAWRGVRYQLEFREFTQAKLMHDLPRFHVAIIVARRRLARPKHLERALRSLHRRAYHVARFERAPATLSMTCSGCRITGRSPPTRLRYAAR